MTFSPSGAADRVIDAVIFDIDDTLIDTKSGFAAAIDAVCAIYLPDLPAARYGEALEVWRADKHGRYREYTRGEIDADTQRWRRANDLHEAFGGEPLDEDGYSRWNEVFWGTFEESWTAHPDAASVLDSLSREGIRVGAVSNASTELQVRKLAAADLADRVPMLVGVDTFGVGKPDPRVFLEGARLLGVAPEHAAYVGDELDVDASGAAAAGLTGVWLDRPGSRRGGPTLEDPRIAEERGIVVVHGLDELPQALGITVREPARPPVPSS